MKKIIIIILASCFLLMFTAFYTYAKSGERLVDWYHNYFHHIDRIETTFESENARLQKAVIGQEESATKDSEEEIMAFYRTTIANSEVDLENYQQAYLSRLTEEKDILGESNFKAYTERKKKEISFEISQDVEDYLTELLGE